MYLVYRACLFRERSSVCVCVWVQVWNMGLIVLIHDHCLVSFSLAKTYCIKVS